MLSKGHLVVRVDGKHPQAVVVMVGSTMLTEITIVELKRVYEQITTMERHVHDHDGE